MCAQHIPLPSGPSLSPRVTLPGLPPPPQEPFHLHPSTHLYHCSGVLNSLVESSLFVIAPKCSFLLAPLQAMAGVLLSPLSRTSFTPKPMRLTIGPVAHAASVKTHSPSPCLSIDDAFDRLESIVAATMLSSVITNSASPNSHGRPRGRRRCESKAGLPSFGPSFGLVPPCEPPARQTTRAVRVQLWTVRVQRVQLWTRTARRVTGAGPGPPGVPLARDGAAQPNPRGEGRA